MMEPKGKGVTDEGSESLGIDWKEALYLATRGGALALGLGQGSGIFEVGAPFDAQCSEFCPCLPNSRIDEV